MACGDWLASSPGSASVGPGVLLCLPMGCCTPLWCVSGVWVALERGWALKGAQIGSCGLSCAQYVCVRMWAARWGEHVFDDVGHAN